MAQHPVQRMPSPSRGLSLLLHLLGIASFSYNFYFLVIWDAPFDIAYGWHFPFLTIIGLSASLVTFVSGALADLTLSPVLFQVKNAVSIAATPLEVVVAILYWGLHLIDPQLLFAGDIKLPLHLDAGFHLFPAVFLTADFLLFSPPWTLKPYSAAALSGGIAFVYWHWVELCFSKNGWYPYPIFELLQTPQRALLFSFAAFLSTLSSVMLKWVYGRVNGHGESHKPTQQLPKKVQ